MLRIHFGAEDYARTKLSAEPDPLWEVLLSLHMLQVEDGPLPYGAWRQLMRRRLPRGTIAPLIALAPAVGYSPDFLTPSTQATEFGEALDQMLSTPSQRVRTDLSRLSTRPAAAAWIWELARMRPGSLRQLGRSVRFYHRSALAPYWQSLRSAVQADHRRRSQVLTNGGVAAVLEGVHPRARWRENVLEIPGFRDDDVHLRGRGLRLQPSYFCWKSPTKLMDDELPPVLVFPIKMPGRLLHPDQMSGSHHDPLAALLGRTRASVLALTFSGCTTTEAAAACDISMATASHQTTVLRDAGLITSQRQGKFVIHRATDLGHGLLEGDDLGSAERRIDRRVD